MSPTKVLLVEDDAAVSLVVRTALEAEGFDVQCAATLAARNARLAEGGIDLLVTDVVLPDGDGLDGLAELAARANCPAIVLSAQNTLHTAVRSTQEAAFEYLPKPFDLAELVRAANAATKRDQTIASADAEHGGAPLVGRSPPMQTVYRTIARLGGNDLTVLISGASGTGKELAARAIHDASQRSHRPFVALNMAAIPRELIETELFGHERGAFTGAQASVSGRFHQAAGGTLFLDEIGDMPIEAQTRLLRVLQSGEYAPVGSAVPRRADVRIIAATHQPLDELIASGRFRQDLYYRLNVVPLLMPTLAERSADIAMLVRHFLAVATDRGLPSKRISAPALKMLQLREWPGNVRELENFVFRLCVLGSGDVIGRAELECALGTAGSVAPDGGHALRSALRQWLGSDTAAAADGYLYAALVREIEPTLFDHVLGEEAGNQLRAADRLGINRNTLRKRLSRSSFSRDTFEQC